MSWIECTIFMGVQIFKTKNNQYFLVGNKKFSILETAQLYIENQLSNAR